MAQNNDDTVKTENVKISERINGFAQKNRKGMTICLSIAAAGIAAFITLFMIRDRMLEKTWSAVEELNDRYETLSMYIGWDDPEALSYRPDVEKLQSDLAGFAAKNSGFPAARVYALIAGIHEGEKKWADAEAAWMSAANAASKTYFAPIAYFRAALAAEEQGRPAAAIAYYEEVLKLGEVFPAAPRAQFAIGRIREDMGDKAAALDSYRLIEVNWPGDIFWGRLAQSRILILE